ncbi:hypothetical protein [Alkalibacillus haloalkaliphilus]|uniref:hypothetical protein n=1 Tax=Alkalibacillus haloalkaliphilus TaxID=94136 RepID=UPI0029357FE7|nr:hypothetical protein [Alkalibacillus haloalkaliphilus]MDV2581414.1 hypothetical protein [Alkalibacillus haloalkaliphilus]
MFIINEIVIIIMLFGFAALATYVLKDAFKSEKKGLTYLLIVISVLILVMAVAVLLELI